MSLELSMAYAKALLEVQPDLRKGLWAFKVCRASRDVIEDVDDRLPSPEYVDKEVSALLESLAKAIKEVRLKPEDSFVKYLPKFVQSVQDRLSDSQKYASDPQRYIADALLPTLNKVKRRVAQAQEKST